MCYLCLSSSCATAGFPAPTVVPGAASGVPDVLLLLLSLFIRCLSATAMYVLLLFCSAASAAALSAICFCCRPPCEHGYCASQLLSVMNLRISKLKDRSICFGCCTSNAVSRLTFIWRLSGGLVPAQFRMICICTLCCCLLLLSLMPQRNRRRFVL